MIRPSDIFRALLSKVAPGRMTRRLVQALETKNALGRYPLSVQIQTVSHCNASCHFCPYQESWHRQNPGQMSEQLYEKIIRELKPYRIKRFCPYLQNEPLLDTRLPQRLEHAIAHLHIDLLEISTNASILTKERIEQLVGVLAPVRNEIWVSFHGTHAENFRSVMGLDFDRCLANVLSLVEAAQSSNLDVVIRGAGMARMDASKMPLWFDEKAYREFWQRQIQRHGFSKKPRIVFFTYHDRAGEIERNEINFQTIVRSDLSGFYCCRIDQWMHFLYNGELILCCMDYHHQTVFGNVAEQSLKDIYTSAAYKKLARQTIGLEESPEQFICKRCSSPGG